MIKPFNNSPTIIKRHSEPNRFDQAPYGTQCEVSNEAIVEIYMQVSSNEEMPIWQNIGQKEKISEN